MSKNILSKSNKNRSDDYFTYKQCLLIARLVKRGLPPHIAPFSRAHFVIYENVISQHHDTIQEALWGWNGTGGNAHWDKAIHAYVVIEPPAKQPAARVFEIVNQLSPAKQAVAIRLLEAIKGYAPC